VGRPGDERHPGQTQAQSQSPPRSPRGQSAGDGRYIIRWRRRPIIAPSPRRRFSRIVTSGSESLSVSDWPAKAFPIPKLFFVLAGIPRTARPWPVPGACETPRPLTAIQPAPTPASLPHLLHHQPFLRRQPVIVVVVVLVLPVARSLHLRFAHYDFPGRRHYRLCPPDLATLCIAHHNEPGPSHCSPS
jgi:hypothetical protein